MAKEEAKYVPFYLLGFEHSLEEDDDVGEDVDLAPAIDRVIDGESVFEVAQEVAKKVLAPHYLKDRTMFTEDIFTEDEEEKVDQGKAFEAWMQGRTDELRRCVEAQLMEGLQEELGDDDEDEDEDDGDDDEGVDEE